METGTHCRWISSLAKRCGCDAMVGNARKLRAIWESSQKNDWKDAQMIANIARTSRELFHPESLRDDEHHALVQLIELRDIVVAQRTQVVNAIRGMCKACGYMLPKCDAGCYFGLTAGQDQSGDIDKPKTITKGGNEMMRKLLVTAANYILRESSKDSALKRYGGRICARGGKIARRKAKVAVARKLAVIMMAMLQSRKPYQDNLAARTDAAGPAMA